jgi:hypothetical protein
VDRLHVLRRVHRVVRRHDHLRQDLTAEDDIAPFGIVGGVLGGVAALTEVVDLQHCGDFSHGISFCSRARNATSGAASAPSRYQ